MEYTGCIFYFTGFEIFITWPPVKGFWRVWSQPILQSLEFMIKTSFVLLGAYCEQRGAKRNKLAVDSLFSQSYTSFQTTRYLGNYWFFRYGLWNKKCFFLTLQSIHKMNQPPQPGMRKKKLWENTHQRVSWSGHRGYRLCGQK